MKNYRNVLIFGYSKSGKAVEKILISHNVEYKIFDDNMRLGGGKYIFGSSSGKRHSAADRYEGGQSENAGNHC